jgi:predicted nucleotidyltransferase
MQHLKKIKMKKLGILAVYLFGSEAEKTNAINSDIDIGILLKNKKLLEDTRPLYSAVYSELANVFKPSFLRELDIVFLLNASLTLQYEAITKGKVIYEEDPVQRADYEEMVINQYMDFKPVLEYFDKIASSRYAS